VKAQCSSKVIHIAVRRLFKAIGGSLDRFSDSG
jgi:hypothetical protein